jgi:SRSO17 transposase
MRVGDARRCPATAGHARRCTRWRWLPASGRRRRLPGGRAPTAGRWCRGLLLWGCVRPGSRSAGRLTAGSCRCAGCWPSGPREPTGPVEYWLANLDQDLPLVDLVRLARLGWRVEHDYRELKDALGLDHFEGRSWPGWHHHVTLVSVAHAFVTLQRLDPKAAAPV